MAVYVEKPRGGDPAALKKRRRNGEARVANPGDGAFTGTGIHENEGKLAEAAADVDEFRANAGAAKFALVECGGGIIADDADVAGAESPPLASEEGSSYLTAGHDFGAKHFDFGSQGGELSQAQDGVRGVFADAEDVEEGSAHRAGCRVSKDREKARRQERQSVSDNVRGSELAS